MCLLRIISESYSGVKTVNRTMKMRFEIKDANMHKISRLHGQVNEEVTHNR